jgi:hypothetical protein
MPRAAFIPVRSGRRQPEFGEHSLYSRNPASELKTSKTSYNIAVDTSFIHYRKQT